jgi:hypothetical protein
MSGCGSFAKYNLVNSEFKLVEYRAKDECDGNSVEPEQYPLIYP